MKLSTQILDEAAMWFVEFGEGGLNRTAREAFTVWLRTSPEHVRAYLQVASRWEESSVLRKSQVYGVEELVAMARAGDTVVPMDAGMRARPVRSKAGVIAVAATLLLGVGSGIAWTALQRGSYATDVGEQRLVKLADGSTVELNSRSRIRVSFDDREREVALLAGQALFRVEKEAARPFVVRSGETRVQAVGTQFDVYRKSQGTVVTVIEGRVAVASDPARVDRYLDAGEQLTVSRAAARSARPDVAAVTAWTEKQIVFQSAPLSEVVEEFNRYNTRQLMIATPGIETTRISGVFSSVDSASILRGLESLGAFSIRQGEERIEIAAKSSVQ